MGKAELDRASIELYRASYAVRMAGAKTEQWDKFAKENGVVDA